MTSVQSGFKKGCPPHHALQAQSVKWKSNSSHVFVASASKFQKLTAEEIQDIFRHRHILIPADEVSTTPFNRRNLAKLGSLHAPRCIQGFFFL